MGLPNRKPIPVRRLFASGALVAIVLPVNGQPVGGGGNAPRPATPRLTRVEQGIADIGPSQVSQRELGVDLRLPTGFGDVYRVSSGSRSGGWGKPNQDSYARIDGGVIAVFPRSVYVGTKNGVMPDIPPGTIFYLGKLPGDGYGHGLGVEGAAPGATWSDTRVDTSVSAGDPSARPTRPATEPVGELMTDESYRGRIVRALLLDAAQPR